MTLPQRCPMKLALPRTQTSTYSYSPANNCLQVTLVKELCNHKFYSILLIIFVMGATVIQTSQRFKSIHRSLFKQPNCINTNKYLRISLHSSLISCLPSSFPVIWERHWRFHWVIFKLLRRSFILSLIFYQPN